MAGLAYRPPGQADRLPKDRREPAGPNCNIGLRIELHYTSLSGRLTCVSAATSINDVYCSFVNKRTKVTVRSYLSIAFPVAEPLDASRDY